MKQKADWPFLGKSFDSTGCNMAYGSNKIKIRDIKFYDFLNKPQTGPLGLGITPQVCV